MFGAKFYCDCCYGGLTRKISRLGTLPEYVIWEVLLHRDLVHSVGRLIDDGRSVAMVDGSTQGTLVPFTGLD